MSEKYFRPDQYPPWVSGALGVFAGLLVNDLVPRPYNYLILVALLAIVIVADRYRKLRRFGGTRFTPPFRAP